MNRMFAFAFLRPESYSGAGCDGSSSLSWLSPPQWSRSFRQGLTPYTAVQCKSPSPSSARVSSLQLAFSSLLPWQSEGQQLARAQLVLQGSWKAVHSTSWTWFNACKASLLLWRGKGAETAVEEMLYWGTPRVRASMLQWLLTSGKSETHTSWNAVTMQHEKTLNLENKVA